MKTKHTTKTVIITTIILMVGGTIAFAHGGWGSGGDGPRMRGNGGPMRGYGPGCESGGYGPGCENRGWGSGDLTKEEAAQLERARENFYTDTKDLRRQIRDLKVDLRDEMAKDDPNSANVLKIQKSLSGLEADFDQKRTEHRLEMKKIAPENFQGRGTGRGFGRGMGKGFGRGYGRGGHCWE